MRSFYAVFDVIGRDLARTTTTSHAVFAGIAGIGVEP
jgi:hypothetical protein